MNDVLERIASRYQQLVGEVFADQFHIERLSALGGNGAVFIAQDLTLDRWVAIKIVIPDLHADSEIAARFLREAKLTARVQHPNIVTVHGAGAADGCLYIVEELLEGYTLAEELALFAGPPRLGIERFKSILRPLAKAHRKHVVHRDVKPGNIMVAHEDLDERIVMMDFGLGKSIDPSKPDTMLTKTGTAAGTVAYMAPEQARGMRHVDARADVWSAGVILYEMLTDRLPWDGAPTWPFQLAAIERQPIPDVREAGAYDIPDDLAEVLGRALMREPARRYADAGAFLAAFEALDLRALMRRTVEDTRWRPLRTRPRSLDNVIGRLTPPDVEELRTRIASWLHSGDQLRLPARAVRAVRIALEHGAQLARPATIVGGKAYVALRDAPDGMIAVLESVGFAARESAGAMEGAFAVGA